MKKLFLSLITVLIGTMSMQAQDDLVATLNHGSTISTFTGGDALAQAYEAAVDGDVITLSPGVFTGVNMDKAIILRGAGYKPKANNGYMSTQISGTMEITLNSEASYTFEMEGLDFLHSVYLYGDKLAPVKISKCYFRESVSGHGISMNAVSCVFHQLYAEYFNGNGNGYKNTTLNCHNCVISYASSQGSYYSVIAKIVAYNCILKYSANSCLAYSVLINSIIISQTETPEAYPLAETCSADHCIGINSYADPDIFRNIANPTNVMVEGQRETAYANVFKTLRNISSISLYETFELTDVAAAQYLGDDGKQVGIYGGNNPFNLDSTNPQVTKFSVSSTNENGQLKVKINVE